MQKIYLSADMQNEPTWVWKGAEPVAGFSAQAENFGTDRRGAWNTRIIARQNLNCGIRTDSEKKRCVQNMKKMHFN